MRDALIEALGKLWKLGKKAILTVDEPLTFLGILNLQPNGDIILKQDKFADSILEKHGILDYAPCL